MEFNYAWAYGALSSRVETVRQAGPKQQEKLMSLFELLDEIEESLREYQERADRENAEARATLDKIMPGWNG